MSASVGSSFISKIIHVHVCTRSIIINCARKGRVWERGYKNSLKYAFLILLQACNTHAHVHVYIHMCMYMYMYMCIQ